MLAHQSACLVSISATRGSVPRECGTWMAIFDADVIGTIGGGRLEYEAIDEARLRLGSLQGNPQTASAGSDTVRYALGPSLGQCCGGEMHLRFEIVSAVDAVGLTSRLKPTQSPLALFGGGHVGKALVRVLATLPLRVSWFDSRDEIFPADVHGNIKCEYSDPVQAAVAQLESGSRVLIMSFSHAEDLDVVAACLLRQRSAGDLPFVGLIGSATKWATFRHRLEARGFTDLELAHVTCPIGIAGITSKEPEAIAVSVAAQILRSMDAVNKAESRL